MAEKKSSKENEDEKDEETLVQTSELEGIESRLNTLERQHSLTYQRMTYEKCQTMLEMLEQIYGINFSGEIVKGYTVLQNGSNAVYICEFSKASDAKRLSTTTPSSNELNSNLAALLYERMERKNNVILMGNSALIDQILNSNTGNKRPGASAEPTPTYEPATTAPSYSEEPLSMIERITNAMDRNGFSYYYLNATELKGYQQGIQNEGVDIYGGFAQIIRAYRMVNGMTEEIYIIEFYNEQDATDTLCSMLSAFANRENNRQERLSNVIIEGNWDMVVTIVNACGR
jgi:hypothetical protein